MKAKERLSTASNPTGPEPTRASKAGQPPTIIVPLDGTGPATFALPVAKGLAEFEGAALHIVHVSMQAFSSHELPEKLQLSSDQISGVVLNQLHGQPAAGIIREVNARRSILIVMCTHTDLGKPPGALGSVAREVLQTATCPVVLVPPERGLCSWTLRRLVLPLDGTPTSAAAVGPVAEIARRAHAELAILHVASPGRSAREPGSFTLPRYVDQPQHEWPVWANEFLDRARALSKLPEDVTVRLFLAAGETGRAIVEFAARNESDLIALAWRGKLTPDHALTAQTVIRQAACPLLLYRV